MATAIRPYRKRRGIAKCVTLDPEACEALNRLPVGHREQGHYLSKLILLDAARRDERERLRLAVANALAEGGEDQT
jgi:hypothetical protein